MDDALHRRRLLAGVGALAATSVAGCTGSVSETFHRGGAPFGRLPGERRPDGDRRPPGRYVAAISPAAIGRFAAALPDEEVEQMQDSTEYLLPVAKELSAIDWVAVSRSGEVVYALTDVDPGVLVSDEGYSRIEDYGGYSIFDHTAGRERDQPGENVGMVAVGRNDLYVASRSMHDVDGLELLKTAVDVRSGAEESVVDVAPTLGGLADPLSRGAYITARVHEPRTIEVRGDYRDEQTPSRTDGPPTRYVGSARAISLGRRHSSEHAAVAIEPGSPVDTPKVKQLLARRFRNGPDDPTEPNEVPPLRYRREGSLVRAERSVPTGELNL